MTRSRPITFLTGALAIPLVALAVGGCGGGNSGGSGGSASAAAPSSTPSGQSATVDSAQVSGLGTVLVDSQGRTLYLFQKDSGGKSACFGACASAWPPLRASGKPTVSSDLNASLVGTIQRSDGKPQVTYNGHPLYSFAEDLSAGQATGQGSTAFGAPWYAVDPAGSQVTSQPSSTGSSSGSSGSSGSTGGGLGY
jgi:predicted lipoprotein with Yx(FWY)xxD motif